MRSDQRAAGTSGRGSGRGPARPSVSSTPVEAFPRAAAVEAADVRVIGIGGAGGNAVNRMIEVGVAGELPPRPVTVCLVRTEPLPEQGQHVKGEKRLVAHERDQRRRAERPRVRPFEDVDGADGIGHATALPWGKPGL